MGLPRSPVEICNIAGALCGEAPISSIDNPVTSTEIIFAANYDVVRQEVLRLGVWNFAKGSIACSRIGGPDPAADYPDIYQLPNDFLRFISIAGPVTSGYSNLGYGEEDGGNIDYDIRDKTFLYDGSGANSITIRYVKDVTDITLWDALSRKVLYLALAVQVAYPITKQQGVVTRLDRQLTLALADAKPIDGQERPPRRIQGSKYLAARKGMIGSDATRYDFD